MDNDPISARRDIIVDEWLARVLGTYPFLTSRYLAEETDRFRNPVGHTLSEALPTLVDELLGDMNSERITSALSQIVKIRVVQDFSASQAVGFIFALREVLCDEDAGPLTLTLEQRIDQMALLAFDLFVECRRALDEIRIAEARRGNYLPDRIHSARAHREAR